jgi:hypothetical protein
VAGLSYQVQYRSDSGAGEWTNLGAPFTATNGMASGCDLIDQGAQRFYRISLTADGL